MSATTGAPVNILFLCSMNQWRSPTAEAMYRRADGINARSAGLSNKARRRVNADDIRWADRICVMEHDHLSRLRRGFRAELHGKEVHVLDIPDDYRFMDPELITLIDAAVTPLLDDPRP